MLTQPKLLLLIVIGLLQIGCSKQPSSTAATDAVLTGSITIETPVTLNEHAVLELTLADISAEDGALPINTQRINTIKQWPFNFSLPYRKATIQPTHRYTITARILSGTQPLYVTDTAYPVLTQGHTTHSDIHLVRSGINPVDSTAHTDAPTHDISSDDGMVNTPLGAVQYRAFFRGPTLFRIEATQTTTRVQYSFLGARLRRYLSVDKHGNTLKLEFEESGKLHAATHGPQQPPVTTAEIATARNQAALLRSHAVAMHAIQAHRKQFATPAETSPPHIDTPR